MWLNRILQRVPAKHETQEKTAIWIANTSWIEDWVKQMVKKDKYFFYKRRLITEEIVSFSDPIGYTMELVREIVKNLGLPSKNIIVAFSGVSSAGKIEHRTGEPYFVEIANKWKNNRRAIAAIIAHEMAHAWIDEQNLRDPDEQTNEKLTDVTAILLGLGALLMNGLSVVEIVEGREWRIQNYISHAEMGYALSVFLTHKNIDFSEVKKRLKGAAATTFDSGYTEFVRRQNEIKNSRQVENWVVLCSGCFQKIRVPNHVKNIEMTCPVCSRKTKYNYS